MGNGVCSKKSAFTAKDNAVRRKSALWSLALKTKKNYFTINKKAVESIKLEHFRNLVSLSAADGKIEEVERVALAKIAYENGIALDRLNFMLTRANEYTYLIPQNSVEREKQLEQMLDLAMVDGDFAPAERDLIAAVAHKLGFSRQELDAIIAAHATAATKPV